MEQKVVHALNFPRANMLGFSGMIHPAKNVWNRHLFPQRELGWREPFELPM
jgi:hypothetical protein